MGDQAAVVTEGLAKLFGEVRALDGVDLELPACGVVFASFTVPVATMPGWLQVFARLNPVTLFVTISLATRRYRHAGSA